MRAFTIRQQLWGLFGLLLLAGATVLIIDEIAQYNARASLTQMKDLSLQRLRHVKAVSDAYGLDVVDTTFRVRNNLIPWGQGVAILDRTRVSIDDHWKALEPMPRGPEEDALFREIKQARARGRWCRRHPGRTRPTPP